MSEQNKARVNLAESRCWNWPCGLTREHFGPCRTFVTDDDLGVLWETEDERDDSPYCECGVVEHGEEEQAFNRCSCCGKRVE